MMNIVLLGNGFDLAHKLPTKYTDFLEWIKAEHKLYTELYKQRANIITKIERINVDWPIETYPSNISVKRFNDEVRQLELWNCISKNVWIDYFLNYSLPEKRNWIDFEYEISTIIKSVDNDMQDCNFYDPITFLTNDFLKKKFTVSCYEDLFKVENERKYRISYAELRDVLVDDLDRLIRAFEIYLIEYVSKIEISVISPDIKNIAADKIISFNYTNTFSKVYDQDCFVDYDYIHGRIRQNDSIYLNNMVLGIDEYLSSDRKNIDTEFIALKKYYQRIHKETGCKYKNWIDIIKQENRKKQVNVGKSYLYIFGHSLDITDGDVLRDLILCDNVFTKIYYLNKRIHGQQIANLVKVIGQDELIRRTGGSTKTIEFIQQQEMINI